jgi:transcriptional antiterminator
MSTEFCPECHQPIRSTVAGVRLPAAKARLYHFIETHPGQSGADLAGHFGVSPFSIRAHILQINDALMNTRVRIKGGQLAGYRVDKARGAE